ncbi:GlsB/YeaQ/YmgE family stress response membrane protein [Streptomyces anulatus]|uniref:GlsB/YeaQ/YmgE family stress response membrane protein n=1 Tax=Streptomyces anulatus TaxID=1892 RepID=UPI003638B0C0
MEISGLVSALLIGAAVGLLGRLVLPGRQHIGVLWTLVVGIVAALLGSLLASVLEVRATRGVDWIEWIFQIALAVLGVAALDRVLAGTARRPLRRD